MVVIFSPCDADDMGLDSILFRVYPIILWGITVSCDLCLFIPSSCSIRHEVSLSMLIGFIIFIHDNVYIIYYIYDYAYSILMTSYNSILHFTNAKGVHLSMSGWNLVI